ncbi:hypothetical protein EP56_01565 [Listeriaceae bacterium FSL A5-0209]|nr:hypothetical protein EP56_01565 [Listeriaceae bacterium FSL A5-0209]
MATPGNRFEANRNKNILDQGTEPIEEIAVPEQPVQETYEQKKEQATTTNKPNKDLQQSELAELIDSISLAENDPHEKTKLWSFTFKHSTRDKLRFLKKQLNKSSDSSLLAEIIDTLYEHEKNK